jgi:hypothetical protein
MHQIQHLVRIGAPMSAVHPLVATGGGLSRWWAEDVESREEEGLATLGFFDRATVYELRRGDVAPPCRVTWLCQSGGEWAGTRLVFAFEPGAADTTLRFRHEAWMQATDYFWTCNTTWGALMLRLRAEAEGQGRGPLFRRNALAL